jgi:TolB-like protein/DNA-binding winged helix-turn-helix (wHTH) protein/Tfp pilus assembly protein PilF
MEPPPRTSIVRFGTYEIALPAGDLRKSGLRIKVQQQPLRLLEILLEHPGEVVTREELRSRIWPNESFGDFDQAVNVAIAKLRTALGDSANNPRFIETLPRRGYRFIADVSVIQPKSEREDRVTEVVAPERGEADVVAGTGRPKSVPRRRLWTSVGVAIGLMLLIVTLGIFSWRGQQPASVSLSSPIRSLAVLPLENLSNSSQDYFADGMTDELITNLAQISALRVISRTSVMQYKGVRKPLGQIANALNVDAIIEGTVLRSGNQVRITAQLIQAPVDKHLWAQSYEGDVRDSLALQKKVARAIAEQIRIKLTPYEEAALGNVKVVNSEAHENYLRGRYFLNKRTGDDLRKAVDYFKQSIEQDPAYALPYTGLADIYQLSDRPQLARQEVQKALALDEQLAEAHTSLARLLYLFDRDWQGADREFRRALSLDHNYAPAHHWYSMYLQLQDRREQALAEAEKACELDPLSAVVGANLAKILEEQGQTDRAMAQARKTLDLEPNSAVTHAVLGLVYQDKRMYPEAIAEFKKALALGGSPEEMRGLLGYALAISGDQTGAQNMIAELKAMWPAHSQAALYLAVVFSGLHDKENALNWLEKAQEAHVSDLISVGRDAHFADVHNDARFQALLQNIRVVN